MENFEEIQVILRDFAGRIAYLATRNDDPITTGNMIADDITNVAWQIEWLQKNKIATIKQLVIEDVPILYQDRLLKETL